MDGALEVAGVAALLIRGTSTLEGPSLSEVGREASIDVFQKEASSKWAPHVFYPLLVECRPVVRRCRGRGTKSI